MSTPNAQLHSRQVFTLATGAYLRAFASSGTLLLTLTLLTGLITVLALSMMPSLARLQLPLVLDESGVGVSSFGFSVLLFEVAVTGGLLVLLVLGVSYVALVRMLHSALAGSRVRLSASFLHGLRHCLDGGAAFLLLGLTVALLAVVTPLLMLLGAVGLLTSLVLRTMNRRLPVHIGWLIAAVIPFGLAVVVAWRGSLALPLIALEGHHPLAAFMRSVRLTGSAPLVAPLCVLTAFVAYFAVQALVGLIGPAGSPAIAVTLISLFTQVLTFAFPMAVLVVITRALRDSDVPVTPLPLPPRPVSLTATAGLASVALLLGFLSPVAAAPQAFAEAGPPPATELASDESERSGAGPEEELAPDPGDPASDATPPEQVFTANDEEEGNGEKIGGEESGGGESGEGEGSETPDQGTPSSDFVFAPELSAQQGEITAPGDPITLWIVAGTSGGGQKPYTFFYLPFLVEPSGEETPLHPYSYLPQAEGGGREANFPLTEEQVAGLSIGQHHFRIHTWFVERPGDERLDGPIVDYTHIVGTVDASTEVSLSASATSFVADEPVELTATVAGDSGPVALGSVTFERLSDAAAPPVTVPVDATGTARTTISGLPVGSHSFQATYRYAATNTLAVSDPVLLTARPYPVSLTLQAPAGSTEFGTPAEFPFLLHAPRGDATPLGTVELFAGSEILDRIELSELQFSNNRYDGEFKTSGLPVGTHAVGARFVSSNGQHELAAPVSATHEVRKATVTLELIPNDGWSLPRGSSTGLRVALGLSDEVPPIPEGGFLKIEIGDDTAEIPLGGGQVEAYVPIDYFLDDLDIAVTLQGLTNYEAEPVMARIVTRAAHTDVGVALTDPALPGEAQGFTAWVGGETSLVPSDGRIEVRLKGSSDWQSLVVDGAIDPTFRYKLGLGTHTIQARYVTERPSEFISSGVFEKDFTVSRSLTTLTATAPLLTPRVGEPYKVLVEVNNRDTYPLLPGPTGEVSASLRGQVVANGELVDGRVMLEIPASVAGEDQLHFSYDGSPTHSSSAIGLTVAVDLWGAEVSLTQTSDSAIVGESVEWITRVHSDVPARLATVVGGTIEFTRGNQVLGTAIVAEDGTARFTTLAPSIPGTDAVRARYLGVPGIVAPGLASMGTPVYVAPTSLEYTLTPTSTHSRDLVEIEVRVQADPRSELVVDRGNVVLSGSFPGSTRSQSLGQDGTAKFSIIAPFAEGQTLDFTIQYFGSDQFAASTATGLIRVDAAPVTVTLSGTEQVVAGGKAIVTAQLASQGATPVPSSGDVDLYAGSSLIASKTVSFGGRVEFELTTPDVLPIGDYELTASFRNSFGYQVSLSEVKPLRVLGQETEVHLDIAPNGSNPRGTPLTATATVNIVWSDLAPYGQVWFRNADTDQFLGQADLSWSYADRSKASFPLENFPIGEHRVYAEYLPTGNLNAASRSATVTFEVTGRSVRLVPFYGEMRVGQPATVQVNVIDANSTDGSLPGGEVDILLGEKLVGTAFTSQAIDPLTSRANITIPLQHLEGGVQDFTVRFRSTNDTHSFATRTDTLTVSKLTPDVKLVQSGDLSRLKWGDDFLVFAYVNRSLDQGAAALPLPSGSVTLMLADGTECTPVFSSQYRCTPNQPGPVSVTATVDADTNYVRTETRLDVGTAAKRTPTLKVDLQPYSSVIETGASQRLSWVFDGPNVRPTVSGVPGSASCSGQASGACEFAFGLSHAGTAQTLEVMFPGDFYWEPVGWERQITPVGCYPLSLRAEPLGSGTLAVVAVDGARCADSGGYRAGTRVGVQATPSDSGSTGWKYQLDSISGRAPGDAVGGLHWFNVGTAPHGTSEIVARFTTQTVCHPVTLQSNGYSNRSWGFTSLNLQPNCPGKMGWEGGSSPQEAGQRTSTTVGWFTAGTVLTPAASPSSSGEFYSARLVPDNPNRFQESGWAQTLPSSFVVDQPLRLQARFGAPCLPVTMDAEGPGTIQRTTHPNCEDEFRAGEFQSGTEVHWYAQPHPDQYGYVDTVTGAEKLQVSSSEASSRQGIARYATWAVPGANEATLTFERCRTLTLENRSPDLSYFTASGSNCPVGSVDESNGIYRYTANSEVRLSSYFNGFFYAQPRFGGWKFPTATSDPDIAALNLDTQPKFNIVEDLTLRPAYSRSGECVPVTVRSGSPLVEVIVAPESRAFERCREGDLTSGWTGGELRGEVSTGFFLPKARATSGNPKLGWVVTGVGADPASPSPGVGTPGARLDMYEAGGRTLTAHACQEVSKYLGLTDASGEFGIAKQHDGTFIEVTPAPNCPFSTSAYLIGTELTLTAGADERGYEFHGWGGVAEPSDSDPRTASYTVEDDSPVVAVTALYQVVCYTLTLTGKAHRVTTLPEANCPGVGEGEKYTGKYIGGTPVALIGEVPGGNIWQGWKGDLVETGKVQVAVAIMDADKSAEHRYRGKSWDEKTVDFFEDAGNALAVAAKKGIGVVAFVAGKALQEVPPFSILGEAFEVISLIGDILNFVGVPDSITKYFDYPAQSLDWVLSGFNCLASASFSSQNGGSSANLSDMADSNQNAINETGGAMFRAIGIDPGDDDELVGATLERLYTAGKSLGYAQKYMGGGEFIGKGMDTIDAGLEIYGMVTGPQGVGWDSSAADAFDSDMGNHITGCMAAATPDFIRGALPISDADFDRYDEEYGL